MSATSGEAATVGVEEEFAVVDGRLRLVGRAADVLATLPPDVEPYVEHELKASQIEIASPVCGSLDELESQLGRLRRAISVAAHDLGHSILAGGTHPYGPWSEQSLTDEPAYRRLEDHYRLLAHEQVLFGCHVHVGVPDADRRIAALDRLRPWLAPLLALTANSPFWEGRDTGFSSYRYVVFSRWPTFVTPDRLGDWQGFEDLVGSLVGSGAIDSPQRLYWTVRPSGRYPTLEFRIGDVCTDERDSVLLAGLCRALVATALDDADAGIDPPDVRPEVLRMAEFQAARYGLDGDLLDPIGEETRSARTAIEALVDHVSPALQRSGDLDRVTSGVQRILEQGNGAQRQRRTLAASGPGALLRSLEVVGEDGRLAPVVDLASVSRRLGFRHDPLEQAVVGGPARQQLRVPLHAEEELVGRLDRLHRPVVGPADHHETVADGVDRLVVERVGPKAVDPEHPA
jgi:carboxylate-amine ligase